MLDEVGDVADPHELTGEWYVLAGLSGWIVV